MICKRCNTENAEGVSYCLKCGNPMSNSVSLNKEEATASSVADTTNTVNLEKEVPVQESYQQVNSPVYAPTQQQYNPFEQNPQQQGQANQPYQLNMPNYPVIHDPDQNQMTLIDWLLRYAINLIPVVGSIIFFVMLFVWSFGDTPKKSLKTWAQCQLLLIVIGVILTLILFAFYGMSLSSELQ